jgi:L-aspartate oxidase
MEFVQFHPPTLYMPGERRCLLTEALRGEGAILRDPVFKKPFARR